MVVRLIAGTGAGATNHAAYEAALQAAGHEQRLCVAQSHMAQSQTGSWAHAALGWLRDERTGCATFIELQHDNLERLQRELHAAALSRRYQSAVPLGAAASQIRERSLSRAAGVRPGAGAARGVGAEAVRSAVRMRERNPLPPMRQWPGMPPSRSCTELARNRFMNIRTHSHRFVIAALLLTLAACGGGDDDAARQSRLPRRHHHHRPAC